MFYDILLLQHYHNDIASIVLDVVNVIDAETPSETNNDERLTLGLIVKEFDKVK